jgi:hypothetical protein
MAESTMAPSVQVRSTKGDGLQTMRLDEQEELLRPDAPRLRTGGHDPVLQGESGDADPLASF